MQITPNQTSSQLKRLVNDGYVRAANISGRSSFYVLSEPLIAIWYQMRFGRTAYQKRRWLIFVLKSLYELEEFRNEQKRLRRQYQKALDAGENARANDILRHQLYLAEAMPESSGTKSHFEYFVSQSMILKNDFLKEELKNPELLKKLSNDLLDQLQTEGYITVEQSAKAKSDSGVYELTKKEHDSIAEWLAGQKILSELTLTTRSIQLQKVLEHFNRSIELNPKNTSALRTRSFFFYNFGKYHEAILDINNEIEIYEELVTKQKREDLANLLASAYMNKGIILWNLGKSNEAISEYEKAIVINEELITEKGCKELKNDLAMVYMNKGVALNSLDKSNEAISEYDKAILVREGLVNEQDHKELKNDLAMVYINKGIALDVLNKSDEAINEYNKAIMIYEELVNKQGHEELADNLAKVYMNKGVALNVLNKSDEAINEYNKAIMIYDYTVKINQKLEISLNRVRTLLNKSEVLIKHKKISQVNKLIREAVQFLEDIKYESLNSWIFKFILSSAEGDDYSNIRTILQDEELGERFFPILRAVDYLETGDEDLIKKLSPEVRGVVEEAVRVLRQTSDDEEISEPVEKTKKRKK